MPWKIKDVDKFKKGLSDKDKEKWIATANAALKQCLDQGGDKLECESSAIRIANSKFSNKKAKKTRFMSNKETQEETEYETRLQFATVKAEETDEYQMVVPVGVFYDDWYGEIIITNSFTETMVDNWNGKAMGNREPFIDTLHDFGKANGWIEDLEARDDGLYAKINWTKMGRENIEEEYYKYFSATIGAISHLETGDKKWPVLFAVALCNTPVMNTMPQAHLSTGSSPAQGDGNTNNSPSKEEPMEMTLADVLEYLKNAKDSERKAIFSELEIDPSQQVVLAKTVEDQTFQIDTLKQTNKDLTTEVETLRASTHSAKKKEVIEKALKEGRILPKDKEQWEGRFDKSPEFTEEVLEGLPKAIDFQSHGDGSGGEGATFSAEEIEVMHNLGLSDEDIQNKGKDVE